MAATDGAGLRERVFGRPPPPAVEFTDGEGSRCRSDGKGARPVEAALDQAPGLGAHERPQIKTARRAA